eukprot:SAG25_NODE_8781_length_404_cov_1.478689_1_plen_49_part_10
MRRGRGRRRPCDAPRRRHMHPLHYWPGTQKFLNPRTGRATLSRVLIGWT